MLLPVDDSSLKMLSLQTKVPGSVDRLQICAPLTEKTANVVFAHLVPETDGVNQPLVPRKQFFWREFQTSPNNGHGFIACMKVCQLHTDRIAQQAEDMIFLKFQTPNFLAEQQSVPHQFGDKGWVKDRRAANDCLSRLPASLL